jgi:hypothetical protein
MARQRLFYGLPVHSKYKPWIAYPLMMWAKCEDIAASTDHDGSSSIPLNTARHIGGCLMAMSKYRPMMVWSVACEMNDLNSLSGTSCKCEISEICEIRSEARILISLNSLFSQVTNTHAKVLGKSNAATLDRNLAYEKDHV